MVSSNQIDSIERIDDINQQAISIVGTSEHPGKVTKKTYIRVFIRFWLFLQNAFNYATMQGIGYSYSMYPAFKELFKNDKKRLDEEVINNFGFYNSNGTWSTLIAALHIKMLEGGASSEDAIKIKLALMGPIAGIGDTLFAFTLTPVLTIIGAQFAQQGNPLGPIISIVGLTSYCLIVSIVVMVAGIKLGEKVVDDLSNTMSLLSSVASIIGITVIVGLSLTFIKFNLDISWSQEVNGQIKTSSIKLLFDNLAPNLLPLSVLTIFAVLISKAKWSIIKVILFTIVVAIVGVSVGFITPM